MKISNLIATLEKIKTEYGDIAITGGYMSHDRPLDRVSVTDSHGYEIWPTNDYPKHGFPIDGVFFESN